MHVQFLHACTVFACMYSFCMYVQFFSHRGGDGCMIDGSMVTTAEWLGHCVSFSTSSPFAVYFSWQKNLPRDKKCKDNLKLTEIDGLKCWTVRHWRCLHSKNNTDQKKTDKFD